MYSQWPNEHNQNLNMYTVHKLKFVMAGFAVCIGPFIRFRFHVEPCLNGSLSSVQTVVFWPPDQQMVPFTSGTPPLATWKLACLTNTGTMNNNVDRLINAGITQSQPNWLTVVLLYFV